jgi:hypothetical protein
MEDEVTGALIHEPDSDGFLADTVTNQMAQAVSAFYPAFRFDPKNVKESFQKAIDSESDPKIKCLLQLIEGLYLARKQNNEEHEELFHRFHLVGEEVERINRNITIAFDNAHRLFANDQITLSALEGAVTPLIEKIVENKKEIKKFEKFKKKHEPRLNRLSNLIDSASDDLKKTLDGGR